MIKKALLAGLFFLLLPLLLSMPLQNAHAAAGASGQDARHSSEAVMQQFAGDDEIAPERRIETERKHQILFIMGIILLILVLTTGSLGVAMVVFDKNVFVAHMICAGLTMSLAAAHAATAIAWFWPY
ncbi:MAG: hypothetical protein Q9M25_02995 [Mariprofundaceae bacterium]|nr:hypothetical protein [Mariprofundaceae bacterium]